MNRSVSATSVLSFLRLVTCRPTIFIFRRILIVLIPILAIAFFVQSLWSISTFPVPTFIEKYSSKADHSTSDHVTADVNIPHVSKSAARDTLFNSLNPDNHLIPDIKNGLLYKFQKPLGAWRNQSIILNQQDKYQTPDQIGSLNAIPLADIRRPIYTYFDKSKDRIDDYNSELGILESWKHAWYAMGFEPKVLTIDDAKKHSQYLKFIKELQSSDKNYHSVSLHFSRFLAWSAVGGGILCDYRVFPMTRSFDNKVLTALRQPTFSDSPLALVKDDSALVVADEPSAKNIVSDIIKVFEKNRQLFTDLLKLQQKFQKSFQQYDEAEDLFAYYSDKNMNLITFGLLEENFGNDKPYDPKFVLLSVRVHLHQIFLEAYPKGVVYIDPISATFTQRDMSTEERELRKRKFKQQLLKKLPDDITYIEPVVSEEGRPNYNALDIIALPAKKIASDLNKCPPAKYGGFTNICRPTPSTIKKIQFLVAGKDGSPKQLNDIKSSDVCRPLPCSVPFSKSIKDKTSSNVNGRYANLNKPAKMFGHLPNPTTDEVFAVSVLPHPLTVIYMCMTVPEAVASIDYYRYFSARDGLTHELAGNVFEKALFVSPLYKVLFLKDSMYQYPAKSNVSWISLETDHKKVGTLMEWEIGFTPLRNIIKFGETELSSGVPPWMDDLGGFNHNHNYFKEASNNLVKSIESEWEGYTEPIVQSKEQLGTRLEMIESIVERSHLKLVSSNKNNKIPNQPKVKRKTKIQLKATSFSAGQNVTSVDDRLKLIDSLLKWSPADGEIITFLRLWTERKHQSLNLITQNAFS